MSATVRALARMSSAATFPLRGNRVVLAVSRPLPVSPDQQTFLVFDVLSQSYQVQPRRTRDIDLIILERMEQASQDGSW